jgi:hypothetical protein
VTIAVSQTADTELAIKAELQVALNERMIIESNVKNEAKRCLSSLMIGKTH